MDFSYWNYTHQFIHSDNISPLNSLAFSTHLYVLYCYYLKSAFKDYYIPVFDLRFLYYYFQYLKSQFYCFQATCL